MARSLLLLCLLLPGLLAVLPAPAWAEEVFVLDSGNIIRGHIVREDSTQVVIRLSGFVEVNRITLRPTEIVHRYTSVDPHRKRGFPSTLRSAGDEHAEPAAYAAQDGVPRTVLLAPELTDSGPEARPLAVDSLPTGEVAMANEGFFARLRRVATLGMPEAPEGRTLLAVLLLVAMTVLVAGGTRLLGMRAASLHASTSLGFLLGVFLVTDILWSDALLRADRAVWVVPLQAVIWLGVARSTLDAPLSKTVPLFAMVLFAATCCVFATGSLLVSV